MSLKVVFLLSCLWVLAACKTQPKYSPVQVHNQHHTIQPRAGFGVNAGFGSPETGFGIGGGFQVGNPLQNDLLFPIIIGLGMLSLFNIVLTILTPLLSAFDDDDSSDDSSDSSDTRRNMRSMDMIHLASTVYEAIEKLSAANNE